MRMYTRIITEEVCFALVFSKVEKILVTEMQVDHLSVTMNSKVSSVWANLVANVVIQACIPEFVNMSTGLKK